MRIIAVAVFILQCLWTAARASNGLDLPYLVLATDTRIVALDMDGNTLGRSIAEENSRIQAVDCHYGTQQVYWITQRGSIKRGDFNNTQNFETIAHDPDAADLAVDWLEDMLYWTNGEASEIRRVDLTNLPTDNWDLIQVDDIESPRFTYIVLNPNTRVMYVMDIITNSLMEIDYTGRRVRNIFIDRRACCLSLSFMHEFIIWHEISSELHVQGLWNQSLNFSHPESGIHVVGTTYYGGKIYWAEKNRLNCKQWNKRQSPRRELGVFQRDVLYDLALMDSLPGNYTGYVPPTSSRRLAPSSTGHKEGRISLMLSTAMYRETAPTGTSTRHVASTVVSSTANNVEMTSRILQSRYETALANTSPTQKLKPTPFSSTPVQQTSRTQAQSSHLYSNMPPMKLTAPLPSLIPTKSIDTIDTSQILTTSQNSESQLIHTNSTAATGLSPLLTSTNTLNSGTVLVTNSASTLKATFSQNQMDMASVHSPLVVSPASSKKDLLLTVTASSTPIATPATGKSSSTGGIASEPAAMVGGHSAAATPLGLLGSRDSHMTSSTGHMTSGTGHMTSGTAESSNSVSIAVVVEPTSSRPLIQPSSVVVTDDTNKHKRNTSTVEAVIITIACLGVAVLIFIGLAILDAIYYFSYERRHGKSATSGILGGVWKLLILPIYYLLLCPRYICRRPKKTRYPYVPRCMNISDVTAYYTDVGQTTTTSLSTTDDSSTGGLPPMDHNVTTSLSTTDHNGSPTGAVPLMDHSGSSNSDYSSTPNDLPNADAADLTIISSNDGNSDVVSYSDGAASLNIDYQGLPPAPAVKQLELETKIALGVADSDDEDFEKQDLSQQ